MTVGLRPVACWADADLEERVDEIERREALAPIEASCLPKGERRVALKALEASEKDFARIASSPEAKAEAEFWSKFIPPLRLFRREKER